MLIEKYLDVFYSEFLALLHNDKDEGKSCDTIMWHTAGGGLINCLDLRMGFTYASGAHTQARYTVVCLCVCLSESAYSCSKINEVKVLSFYRLLVRFSWIAICGLQLHSSSYGYLECHCT